MCYLSSAVRQPILWATAGHRSVSSGPFLQQCLTSSSSLLCFRCLQHQRAACVSSPALPGLELTPLRASNPARPGLVSFGATQPGSPLLILPKGEVTPPNLPASPVRFTPTYSSPPQKQTALSHGCNLRGPVH